MAQVKDWIHAARLRTLPLSVAGILTGSAVALLYDKWNTIVFGLAMATTLLFQLLSNLANDLGDTQKGADNAQRVGPQRAVQSGAISPSAMRNAVIFIALLSLCTAGLLIWQGGKQLSPRSVYGYIGLAIACVIAAITYTMGRKAYGYFGFGDVFVFLFFGGVSVMGVYPLFTNSLPWELLFPAITIGGLSTAVLNLNNMRDQVNDAAVGKRTLVVKLGFQRAKVYHLLLLFSSMLSWIVFIALHHYWLGLISCLPFVLFIKHAVFVIRTTEPRAFDPELKKIALGTFFTAVLFILVVLVDQWLLLSK